MPRPPLVSVILTSYNHGAFVEEALASVLLQSFADLEVLVIENSDGLRLDEDGELGINTSLQTSQTNSIFIVIRGGSNVDLRFVNDLIHRLKPAHATFTVRLSEA